MKDGPRRSAKMQDTLTTDANERSKTYYILRRKRTTRVYYDGCEREETESPKTHSHDGCERHDTIDWKQKVLPRKEDMLTTNTNDAMDTKRDTGIDKWSRNRN